MLLCLNASKLFSNILEKVSNIFTIIFNILNVKDICQRNICDCGNLQTNFKDTMSKERFLILAHNI